MKTLIILALLGLSSTASAQLLLKDGEVHTVSGDVLPRASVLVAADGTISAVDTVILPPPGIEVIDCTGKIITPGLVETQSSLGAVEIWAVKETRDNNLDSDPIRAAFRVADGINPRSSIAPVVRAGGITSVVSSPSGGLISGQGAWIDLAGDGVFLTVARPTVAFFAEYGSGAASVAGGTRGGAALMFRELFDDVAFFKKNQRLFDENRSRHLSASRLDLLVLQTALDGSVPMVFSAHRASDITAALDLARAFNIKPIIAGGSEAWMVADELAKANVPVILQPLENLPFSFESLGSREDNAALLEAAKVRVILSTFDTHRGGALRQYAGNAVRAGMSHAAALRAVTLEPAIAFGMDKQYGSIQKGKTANLVVWSGDPFEPLTNVEAVIIGGQKVSTENRQTRLFKKYRTLDRRAEPARQKVTTINLNGDAATPESN